ncbi:hypothetical protein HII31_11717 [Pseudocercospora fuligena]|uniref:Uncharacterized protein n=1 Tax=Pseudocercospora fuligena TaxID=685502 RepID=A0A8H6R9F5_9PEZI|nr:hypothetical protein HII31_11717 [Pseudocercospora fuligena]
MGPSTAIWWLEPRCHCSLRRLLHASAYSEPETTQVCDTMVHGVGTLSGLMGGHDGSSTICTPSGLPRTPTLYSNLLWQHCAYIVLRGRASQHYFDAIDIDSPACRTGVVPRELLPYGLAGSAVCGKLWRESPFCMDGWIVPAPSSVRSLCIDCTDTDHHSCFLIRLHSAIPLHVAIAPPQPRGLNVLDFRHSFWALQDFMQSETLHDATSLTDRAITMRSCHAFARFRVSLQPRMLTRIVHSSTSPEVGPMFGLRNDS